ncbi:MULTISPECIES: hypothetical protein [unclassified Mucilaginibacter]|uniref:hypothetical protein n=2 Tax=Pseudomonadati TaxID=3379134 RepID=UPI002AC8F9C0|nr:MULTISPECIES: hypothetical protein [unclassified Mucilaginibacter]MEB0261692.1 hypothetical protein [Mucilaginibacter sp. 10I4]MEB0278342.1 hypothetical protein [Mucilaginibacter sp. 10B2]MEB0301037.1 hypothetical protein [Mucilaginibacter sp. 5C4]WPX23987.1 hypothetical protein RHM67_01685 [Mucilaginibacter sp. 5C4]
MKKLTFISGIILCLIVTACSKKDSATPANQTHTIKITASGTADFAAVISTAANVGADPLIVKSVSVATGTSFEFSIDATANSYIFLKLSSDVENNITYKIYDNGTVVEQESAKEFATHSTATVQHQVQ